MAATGTTESSKILESIINTRRTVRRFTVQAPSRDLVERVIHAGLQAPYSGLGISRPDFRRVVVIPRESPVMTQATMLLRQGIQASCASLEQSMKTDPEMKVRGQAYLNVLTMSGKQEIPILAKAPFYLVVAEEKAIPHVEHCSIAHCMQNMWLEATALGLGFQLVTATQSMSENSVFAQLLGLPPNVYVLDGCLLGYAAEAPAPVQRPDPRKVVTWL